MPREIARDQDKFVLRLPDGMRERLKAEAEANKRSMNAEIVARIEDSFEARQRMDAGIQGVTELLTTVIARVASDMRREGKTPEEFTDWVRSFPDFAPFIYPKDKGR